MLEQYINDPNFEPREILKRLRERNLDGMKASSDGNEGSELIQPEEMTNLEYLRDITADEDHSSQKAN